MVKALSEALQIETDALEQLGLTATQFEDSRKLTPGTRRKMFEYPKSAAAAKSEDGAMVVEFELPSGSFATVLLAEIVKELR
jgi:tRNA(Glu) U13 pseudouridine synthase TruD